MPSLTVDKMWSLLHHHGRPLASFRQGDVIRSYGYSYTLSAVPGILDDNRQFSPDLTPGEMLLLGVFEGRYLNDCIREFPAEWFIGALTHGRLSPEGADPDRCNLFKVKSRQSLRIWQENGWVPKQSKRQSKRQSHSHQYDDDRYHGFLADPTKNPDERGWFQWYCRYWMGRRIPELDSIQIGRWRSFRRHAGAIRANCRRGDLTCRPKERQALLQWAYNPFI